MRFQALTENRRFKPHRPYQYLNIPDYPRVRELLGGIKLAKIAKAGPLIRPAQIIKPDIPRIMKIIRSRIYDPELTSKSRAGTSNHIRPYHLHGLKPEGVDVLEIDGQPPSSRRVYRSRRDVELAPDLGGGPPDLLEVTDGKLPVPPPRGIGLGGWSDGVMDPEDSGVSGQVEAHSCSPLCLSWLNGNGFLNWLGSA